MPRRNESESFAVGEGGFLDVSVDIKSALKGMLDRRIMIITSGMNGKVI